MPQIKISEIRAKFPMYSDVPDDQLISGIRAKFYPDIPMGKFSGMIDYDTQRAALQKEVANDAGGVMNFAAGAGKAFTDLGRGVGQLVGAVSPSDIEESRRLDAGLMNTGAGLAGNIAGNVAAVIPSAAIPGAATLPGAAAAGAALGFLSPVGEGESRLKNTAVGGAAGAGGVVAGRAVLGGIAGARALLAPFTDVGRKQIAGTMLERFASDPASIASAQSARTATGALPTLAEQTGDAGLARLQDSLRSIDPQIANRIGGRLAENNAARVQSLQSLAPGSAARDAAVKAREDAAGLMYRKAFVVDGIKLNQRGVQEAEALMAMPAIQQAAKDAQRIAANKGINIANPEGSAQGLHFMKLALDDAINAAGSSTAAQRNAASGIKAAQQRLVAFLEDLRPDYKAARTTYADMSKPINAIDVGEEIAKRATSNLSDLAGNPRLQANALAGMLRDEPALIQRATGRKGINSLSDVLDPAQVNLLRQVLSESDRAAAVAAAGNGPGSATAQRMASQNILRQILGPTGLPQSWAENTLAMTALGKPLNIVYGGIAEPKIRQILADAVLDPNIARQVLEAARRKLITIPDNALTKITATAAKSTAPVLALEPRQR